MKTLLLLLTFGGSLVRADDLQDAARSDSKKVDLIAVSELVRSAAKGWRSVGLYRGSTTTGEQTLESALFGECKPRLDTLTPTMLEVLGDPDDHSGNLFCIHIDFGAQRLGDKDDLMQSAQFSSKDLYIGGENHQKVRMRASGLFQDGSDSKLEFTLSQLSEACKALTTSNKSAEQAGTGQPATRPESKSEGGDKPQPEAEGRSR